MPLFSVFMEGRGVHFHLWLALQFMLIAVSFGVGVKNQSLRCIEAEKRALLDFKRGLIDKYNLLASWTSEEEDCCKWKRVGCDNTTGHVVMLNLGARIIYDDFERRVTWTGMRGEISSSLLELKHLSHLDLSFNSFDKIPEFMGSLTELTYLNLSSNSLTGTIPPQLGNLSRLLYLDLSDQYGLISDNLEWLSRLSSLKLLKFGFTNFINATNWLQVIQSHPSLSILHFEACDLAEVDPSSLSQTNASNSLSVLHLVSSIPLHPSIFPMLLNISSNLVELDLSDNRLPSTIPDCFDNMPALERINFEENILEGGRPKSLGNLCSLKELNFGFNKLSGALTVAVGNLSGCAKDSLEILKLGTNRFNGSVPSFEPFSSLRELEVENNRLSGHFQDNFGNNSKLMVLNFDGNQFTGPFPNLSRLSSLRKLSLGRNRLEGPLPVSIRYMSQLVHLDVSSNSLHGSISEAHLFHLTKLRSLIISYNPNLSFHLSSDWIPPFQLDYIDMSSCELGPKFPSWLRKQTNFSHLDISHSNISDTIPDWFWNLPSTLTFLNLSFNKISGSVPNLQQKFDYITTIDLSWNHFSGLIPRFLSNLTVLDLSNNRFSGTLSFLCTATESDLSYLDLSNNLISGGIPDCWSHKWLSVINLENNNLSGVIPSSLGSVTQLESLRLRNTSLHGEIPQSMKNCTQLKLFDLGENKLTGIIPPWIGERLWHLIVLRLRSNEFHGELPSTICQQQFLQVLDLSLNNISGTIPSCLNNLVAMTRRGSSDVTIQSDIFYIDTDHTGDGNYNFNHSGTFDEHLLVIWKGVEQEYGKTLGLLKVIDLSCNKIGGEIPEEIATLQGLITLNLSTNMLKGSIIREIGQLSALESLDLSANNLSGEVPKSLSGLSFLSVLNLSNNNLSGKIPLGTQLQSFDAASYSENPGLCGAPLRKCPGDETPKPPNTGNTENNTEGDEEWFEPLWFFTGMTAGFLVGFCGIFGSLLINGSWRHRYFQMVNKSGDWISLTVALKMAKLHHIFGLKG